MRQTLGLIGLDNRLRHLTLGLELLQAAFYRGQLILQSGGVFWYCCLQVATLVLRSFSEVEASADRSPGTDRVPRLRGLTRTFHQLLLRHHASLQSGDRRIDPGILLLVRR